eukprot:m.340204 g.340204  ORF g.340204 m.340204 type:complete len:94 (+) comp19181_c0_seq1:2682-2963(+)
MLCQIPDVTHSRTLMELACAFCIKVKGVAPMRARVQQHTGWLAPASDVTHILLSLYVAHCTSNKLLLMLLLLLFEWENCNVKQIENLGSLGIL